MRTELNLYLKEDEKRRKKLEQERDEERILRNIKERYEQSDPLTVDDIKTSTKILFKLIKESYENKDFFLNDYIDHEKNNLSNLKSGNIDMDQYTNNKQGYLHTYTIYVNEIQQKIEDLYTYTKYLNFQIEEHLNECNGRACISNSIIKYKGDVKESDIVCEYKGFCVECVGQANVVDYMAKREFCKNCKMCKVFIAEENKVIAKKGKEIFHNQICKTSNKLNNTQNIITESNITINETVPIENSTNNFVFTYDRYVFVKLFTHGTTRNEQINRLRYIFTYLMCGIYGKSIFPYEPKHSEAKTYPVVAAIYSLKLENDSPILYGLIRYKHIKTKSHITIKQLQQHNQPVNPHHKTINEIRICNLWQDKKRHICVKDINHIISLISEDEVFGSDIKKFYLDE